MSSQECMKIPPGIPLAKDVAANIGEMLKNSGAGEVCKQAMTTYAQSLSASVSAKASIPFAEADLNAQTALTNSGVNMSQSGCGQYITTASNIANQNYQMQCILQNNTKNIQTETSMINNITIETKPLTDTENTAKLQAFQTAQSNKQQSINSLIGLITALVNTGKDTKVASDLLKNTTFLNSFTNPVEQLYSRDINLTNINISQSINALVNFTINLSNTDSSNISALASLTANQVAEADAKSKLGVGALSPEQKTTIANSQDIINATSSSAINNKVSEVKSRVINGNTLLITAPGSINLEFVTIDQNIVTNVITSMIMSDAISAGLAASAQIVGSALQKAKTEGESAGAEALVAALGKANADAIAANKVTTSTIQIIAYAIAGLAFMFLLYKIFVK